jgi:hypothetical protein
MTTCRVCGGNNEDMPCIFPSEGKDGCLRLNVAQHYTRGWEDVIVQGLAYTDVESSKFPVGECDVIPDGQDIIGYSTVYIDRLPDDNRKFRVRFSGMARDLVEKRAVRYRNTIDSMRSPHIGCAYKLGHYWYVEVTWYSVD